MTAPMQLKKRYRSYSAENKASYRGVCGIFFVKFQQASEAIESMIDIKHEPFGGKDFLY